MTLITPAAFISLFGFALLAGVIIQGPLGPSSAFAGEETILQATAKSSETGSNLLSTFNPKKLSQDKRRTARNSPCPA